MNLDPKLLEIIVCPDCHGALARRGRGAGLPAVRTRLPGARRHPGAAGRRGPPTGLTRTHEGLSRWRPGSTSPASTTRPRWPAPTTRLRELAEAGARVRREAVEAAPGIAAAVAAAGDAARPRAVVAAGPDSRLLRAVLEPWCPVPFVAWPGPALPGWAGGLDLVVVLAPDGTDRGTAAAVAEAVRRGCQVVVACPAELAGRPPRRRPLVHDRADGRPRPARHRRGRAGVPRPGAGSARAPTTATSPTPSTTVAVTCSPHRDLAVNPAKMLAIALADTNPVVWGGSVARRPRRPPGRRDDPPGDRPVGDRR